MLILAIRNQFLSNTILLEDKKLIYFEVKNYISLEFERKYGYSITAVFTRTVCAEK